MKHKTNALDSYKEQAINSVTSLIKKMKANKISLASYFRTGVT